MPPLHGRRPRQLVEQGGEHPVVVADRLRRPPEEPEVPEEPGERLAVRDGGRPAEDPLLGGRDPVTRGLRGVLGHRAQVALPLLPGLRIPPANVEAGPAVGAGVAVEPGHEGGSFPGSARDSLPGTPDRSVLRGTSDDCPPSAWIRRIPTDSPPPRSIPALPEVRLSIRELIRQGYLFGGHVLVRQLIERVAILNYLHPHPDRVDRWQCGWTHGDAPNLATMLDGIRTKQNLKTDVTGSDVTGPMNTLLHARPDSAAWNTISLGDARVGHAPSKILGRPDLCDELCATSRWAIAWQREWLIERGLPGEHGICTPAGTALLTGSLGLSTRTTRPPGESVEQHRKRAPVAHRGCAKPRHIRPHQPGNSSDPAPSSARPSGQWFSPLHVAGKASPLRPEPRVALEAPPSVQRMTPRPQRPATPPRKPLVADSTCAGRARLLRTL